MPVHPIRQAGDPVLRQRAKKVTVFDQALAALAQEMVETMEAAPGIGLAAPQIGVPLQILVTRVPPDDERVQATTKKGKRKKNPQWVGKLFVLCNPEIIKSQGEEESTEGCLSLPGFVGDIKRATTVTVKGKDLQGKEVRIKAQGLLARVFQHEIDHLQGRLFTDRLETMDKLRRLPAE